MNDLERTLEHYRHLLELTVREHEAMKAVYTPRTTTWKELSHLYTKFVCVNCFVPCEPKEDNTCGNCWRVGDKVTTNEGLFTVVKLYTFNWGRYGCMTGIADDRGNYYEYFNECLKKA